MYTNAIWGKSYNWNWLECIQACSAYRQDRGCTLCQIDRRSGMYPVPDWQKEVGSFTLPDQWDLFSSHMTNETRYREMGEHGTIFTLFRLLRRHHSYVYRSSWVQEKHHLVPRMKPLKLMRPNTRYIYKCGRILKWTYPGLHSHDRLQTHAVIYFYVHYVRWAMIFMQPSPSMV